MLKAVEDKDGTVRDGALHCMGILKGRLTDSVMANYLKDVNKQKMDKIDEASKEVKPSKYDKPENWKPPPPKKAPVKKAAPVEDDDDQLMSFDNKPKKAPPKGIGQKPKKKTEDADMKDEETKAPAASKPPAKKPELSSNKPKTAASTKGPSAPVI
jgi:hypothetical protein